MTAVAVTEAGTRAPTQVPTEPRREPARRARPSARVVVIGGLIALVVAGFGLQYRRAGDRLEHHRRVLAATEVDLATTQRTVRGTHVGQRFTDVAITSTRTDIDEATFMRADLDARTQQTMTAIAGVRTEITETETSRFLVAANAAEARQCFAGVANAVLANGGGNDGVAAGALRDAKDACTRTLAYSTGARFPFDFPDPYVLRTGGAYYGYATNSGAGDIQVIRSTDLVNWDVVGNALPRLPRWASAGSTWAPAVLARGNRYVVYYTVREASTGRQCVSRATAGGPAGPFTDDTAGPLTCGTTGAIDPSPFVDADGRAFLLWKTEAAPGTPAMLRSQALSADGLQLTGSGHGLLGPDRSYEQGVVEAPSMVRDGASYYLVYSAANWTTASYAVGFATCAGPTGPCTKPSDNRILASGARLAGPGGAEIFRDGSGALHVAYHAYSAPNVGYPNSRYFYVAPMQASFGRLVIDAST